MKCTQALHFGLVLIFLNLVGELSFGQAASNCVPTPGYKCLSQKVLDAQKRAEAMKLGPKISLPFWVPESSSETEMKKTFPNVLNAKIEICKEDCVGPAFIKTDPSSKRPLIPVYLDQGDGHGVAMGWITVEDYKDFQLRNKKKPALALPEISEVKPCPSCQKITPLPQVEKIPPSAKKIVGQAIKDTKTGYFDLSCPSIKVQGSNPFEMKNVFPAGLVGAYGLSSDGSRAPTFKDIPSTSKTVCEVKMPQECNLNPGSIYAPQEEIANSFLSRTSKAEAEVQACKSKCKNSANCINSACKSPLSKYDQSVDACRAATEQFYNSCDRSLALPLEERRNKAVAKIQSAAEEFNSHHEDKINKNLAVCMAAKENPDFQPFRLNLLECENFSSRAVGLFQVQPQLVSEVLSNGFCKEIKEASRRNKTLMPSCDEDFNYGTNSKESKTQRAMRLVILRRDSQVLFNQMATDLDLQVLIGVRALSLYSKTSKKLEDTILNWLVGPNDQEHRKLDSSKKYNCQIQTCYRCMSGGGSDCLEKANTPDCEP